MPELLTQPIQLSRSDARKLGAARYFTGKPCKHGHIAPRITASGNCITCVADTHRRYRRANRATIAERERWYWANRQEERRVKNRRWAAKRTVEQRATAAATKRRYYDRNQPACIARAAAWKKENPQRHRENARRYALGHPELVKAKDFRRRARKHAAVVGDRTVLTSTIRRLRTKPRVRCYWCRCTTTPHRRHLDHIIPLSRGGAHAVGNLCVACPPCNQRKSSRLPEEFAGQAEMALA